MKTLTVLLLLVLPIWAGATNFTSTANGNWSNALIWTPTGLGIPGAGDNVTIANTVTLDGNESVNKDYQGQRDFLLGECKENTFGAGSAVSRTQVDFKHGKVCTNLHRGAKGDTEKSAPAGVKNVSL